MWFRLYADEFFECRLDRSAGLVQVVRSTRPFARGAEIATCFGGLDASLGLIPRERMGLLIDVRGGPARIQPAFKESFEQHRVLIARGFRAVVVLVRTATGGAQVRRITREDEVEHVVFHEEDEALDYLRRAIGT